MDRRTTRTILLVFLAQAALSLPACTSAYEAARDRDTPEAYREFLRKHPDDPSAKAARMRLSELEFLSARRLHTLPAYKRFLVAFPNSPRAQDAKLLIEGIRFEMASEKDTSEAWLIFLRDHAQGPHAKEARARLEEADYRAIQNAATSSEIRLFLGRHPDTAHRQELEKRLDELEFQEAEKSDARGLTAYLNSNPAGIHRSEVRGAILSREAKAEAALGNFERARHAAQKIVDDAPREELLADIDLLEVEWVTANLSMKELDDLIQRLEDRHEETPALEKAKENRALLKKLGAGELKRLSELIDPAYFAQSEESLLSGLKSADPRNRWRAAMELAHTAGEKAIDPLLNEAAASRFSRVRQAAFLALTEIFRALPKDAVDISLRARASELEKKAAQDAMLFVKLAILDELVGDTGKAETAYENALRLSPGDTFALRRSIALNQASGRAFRAAVLARELAFRARHQADQWSEEGQSSGVNAMLMARTLCGTLDDAEAAKAHLEALSPKAREDLSEDAPKFIALAEEAAAFAKARLADAEAEARSENNSFVRCGDESDLQERLSEGKERRLKAVSELSARGDLLRDILLRRMAQRDPEAEVRQAASQALGDKDSEAAPAAESSPAAESGEAAEKAQVTP